MGETVERLRYIAHEIRILPATEANLQRLHDLMQEAVDTMADHIEAEARKVAVPASSAPTPTPVPVAVQEAQTQQAAAEPQQEQAAPAEAGTQAPEAAS